MNRASWERKTKLEIIAREPNIEPCALAAEVDRRWQLASNVSKFTLRRLIDAAIAAEATATQREMDAAYCSTSRDRIKARDARDRAMEARNALEAVISSLTLDD